MHESTTCLGKNDGASRIQVMPTDKPGGPALEEEERKEAYKEKEEGMQHM